MQRMTKEQFESLAGEVLTNIDISADAGDDHRIMLTTQTGRQIVIEHDQDCCEYVKIESVVGDPQSLIGKAIVRVNVDERPQGDPKPEYADSWTWTIIELGVTGETVLLRWIGESNGYYSESVDFKEIAGH